MDLDLKIAGESVVMPTAFNCEFVRQSSLLLHTEVNADFVPDISLPFNPINDRIMNFWRLPQMQSDFVQKYAEFYYKTNRLTRGYVFPVEAIDSYKLYFSQGLENSLGNIKDKKLWELDFGTISLPANYSTTLTNTALVGGFVCPTIQNADFYQVTPGGGYSGKVNDCTSSVYTAGTKVPMFFARYILDKIGTMAGFSFSGDWYSHALFNRLLVYNTQCLDAATVIRVQDHLPDMRVADFILQIAQLANTRVAFDVPARTINFRLRKTIHTAEVTKDWTKKTKDIKGKSPVKVPGIEIKLNLDSNDTTAIVTDNPFQNYITPALTTDEKGLVYSINSMFSTLQTSAGLPISKQQGIAPGQADKKFAPRLLQWAGVVSGVPTALSDFGGYSLDLNGATGLYNSFFKEEETFRRTTFRTPEITLNLTAADLANWSPDDKVHINGVNYYFEYIKAPLHRLTEGCKAIGWKV
jgi:hypothetical protein